MAELQPENKRRKTASIKFLDYTNFLFDFTKLKYSEQRIRELIACGCWAEVLTELDIEITNQLKFLFLKRTKNLNGIPLDNTNQSYRVALDIVKKMTTYSVIGLAYAFKIINVSEYNALTRLNKMRNVFDHSFTERESEKERQVIVTVNRVIKIQRRLSGEVEEARRTGIIPDIY